MLTKKTAIHKDGGGAKSKAKKKKENTAQAKKNVAKTKRAKGLLKAK